MTITAFAVAQRFVGLTEVPGAVHNPAILTMLKLDQSWPASDEVPWCSAFVNYVCWLLRLPRSKSLAARSWLTVGQAVTVDEAVPDADIVVLSRGLPPQPGKEVTEAPGHVGFFVSYDPGRDAIQILGGNQRNGVSMAWYSMSQVLDIRRLA